VNVNYVPYSERTYFIYGNIMYDRRVIRGNTYAQTVIPSVRYRMPFSFVPILRVNLLFSFIVKAQSWSCIVISVQVHLY